MDSQEGKDRASGIRIFKAVTKDGMEITSLEPVRINNWLVKASTTSLDSIVIVMTNIDTGATRIGTFNDELTANYFVIWVAGSGNL